MKQEITNLLHELKSGLQMIYGDRLKGIYLYGSYARGEEDRESDVDILIVLDQFHSYGDEIDRTGPLVAEISLKYGISISRVFVSHHEWLIRESYFLSNISDEAIPA
jgi:predicted nucleotidyltransferase